MGLSKNLAHYDDIEAVLSAAYAEGGGTYSPPTNVTRWIQRAYTYRKLLSEKLQSQLPPGSIARTNYDTMTLKKHTVGNAVEITFRSSLPLGTFQPIGGKPAIKIDSNKVKTATPADDLLSIATSLVEEYGADEPLKPKVHPDD